MLPRMSCSWLLATLIAAVAAPARAVTFVVMNTNAAGSGSLAEAITNANADGVLDMIEFDIPGAGVPTIVASLPAITQPVMIDGTTQTAGLVEIRNGGGTAINITGDGSTIKGLVLNSSSTGVALGAAANGNTILGCLIGTDVTGTSQVQNQVGVFVQSTSGSNTITNNIISGNTQNAITIIGNDTIVTANVIGLDVTQTQKITSGGGILINNSSNNRVGGTQQNEGNVIAGLTGTAVNLQNAAVAGTLIQGNRIGTNAANATGLGVGTGVSFASVAGIGNVLGGSQAGAGNVIVAANLGVSVLNSSNVTIQGNTIGTAALPHTSHGIDMIGADNNTLEDNVITGNGQAGINFRNGADGNTIRGNEISGNAGAGIAVSGGQMDRFTENLIHDNGGLGIDLGVTGVNQNDALDADVAPGHNDAQNYPVLDMVSASQVTGTFNSLANTMFTVELFATPSCDASGNGEGETFLGAVQVMTDASGDADVMFSLPAAAAGKVITATATAPDGDTSEFSACTGLVPSPTTTSSQPATTTSIATTTTSAAPTTTTAAPTTTTTQQPTTTTTVPTTTTTTSLAATTSTSAMPSTSTTSSSTSTSSSAPITTTTSPSTTTTTTLAGGCATEPVGPTFRSLNCRLAALLAQVAGASELGPYQAKLRRVLESAKGRKEEAETACSGTDSRRAKQRLKQANRKMISFGHTLRANRARKTIPAAVREPLLQAGDAVRTDLKTLRGVVRCPNDAP